MMISNTGAWVKFNGPAVTIHIPSGLIPDEVVNDISKAIQKQLAGAPLNEYSKKSIYDILDSTINGWINGTYTPTHRETTKLILHDGE